MSPTPTSTPTRTVSTTTIWMPVRRDTLSSSQNKKQSFSKTKWRISLVPFQISYIYWKSNQRHCLNVFFIVFFVFSFLHRVTVTVNPPIYLHYFFYPNSYMEPIIYSLLYYENIIYMYIQLISNKRFLECTLIQSRLSIYP